MNKHISQITYNSLNLPTKLNIEAKGTIKYIYDATGRKLRKITLAAGETQGKTTTYNGSYVYENNELQYILMPEGRPRSP